MRSRVESLFGCVGVWVGGGKWVGVKAEGSGGHWRNSKV